MKQPRVTLFVFAAVLAGCGKADQGAASASSATAAKPDVAWETRYAADINARLDEFEQLCVQVLGDPPASWANKEIADGCPKLKEAWNLYYRAFAAGGSSSTEVYRYREVHGLWNLMPTGNHMDAIKNFIATHDPPKCRAYYKDVQKKNEAAEKKR